MKELEGKTVFLKPTGNNVRRSAPNRIQLAKIVKVNRKTVDVLFDTWTETRRLTIREGRYLDSGCNGGYVVYLSKQEIEDELFVMEAAQKICNKYRWPSDFCKLSKDQITKIAEILGVEI